MLVVGTAERHIQLFDLRNPTFPAKTVMSPLKWQTRAITCFPASSKTTNGPGFAIGSIEGRTAIHYAIAEDGSPTNPSYTFRSQRQETPSKQLSKAYAVNDVSFHPMQTSVFTTCGSDGSLYIWDRDARSRLKSFPAAPGSISSTTFNRTGELLAYAISYDWSIGHTGMKPSHPNKLMIHKYNDKEFIRKTGGRR
jgi:mRNA export factor